MKYIKWGFLLLLVFVSYPVCTFADIPTYIVGNEEELIAAIGPDRVIQMKPYCYDLSKPIVGNSYVHWEQVYDGAQIVISNLENLKIEGLGKEPVQIVVRPRYSFVLNFKNVNQLTLSNLDIGHTLEGYCQGGVIYFENCNDLEVSHSRLYGCGTEGLYLCGVAGLVFHDSCIEKCTYDMMTIQNSRQITFKNAKFQNNREFDQIQIVNGAAITFSNCEVRGNLAQGSLFKINNCQQITIENTVFANNQADYFIVSDSPVETSQLKFSANRFKKPENIFAPNVPRPVITESRQKNPFRAFINSKWGMKLKDIKKREKNKLIIQDANNLIYRATILDLDCLINYSFERGGLDRIVYKIKTDESLNEIHRFTDYYRLYDILVQKYGKPVSTASGIFPSGFWTIKLFDAELELWVNPKNIDEIIVGFFYTG